MPPSGDTPPLPPAWLELPDKCAHALGRDCYFGRIEGNEIVIGDHRVSRRHAVVRCEGRRFVLVDLGSTNGTLLNQTRIHKPTVLNDGDEIVIGGQRHVFCQPVTPGNDPDDSVVSTAVVVAKTPCWMLLAAAPESGGPPAADWIESVKRNVAAAGARVKSIRDLACLAHWRIDTTAPAAVRAVILQFAATARPPGARLALHVGAVRVGAGAGATEENVLGAEVTFTHKLETAAVDLGIGFIASEPAVQSLDLASHARALGSQTLRGGGTHTMFAL